MLKQPAGRTGFCLETMSRMNLDTVLHVLASLEDAGVRVWLDGGWGVDALLGEQTRSHSDLDLILNRADAPMLREALGVIGFTESPGSTPASFVMVNDQDARVDLHPIEFDDRGYGIFTLADGRRWPFPPAAFSARGCLGTRSVSCLSADAQVQCHAQGYEPAEKDILDMNQLQKRFGVTLPISLCRQPDEELNDAP